MIKQKITETLTENYMPYAMSVIVSRAIPEIDGFKPSHRKLLYTMYKMGLLNGGRTKSANVVGQTMRLNPHGDGAIYETMVRLSRGCEALLTPFVDSKGNFGKIYSRDMAYAASRYTEVKLDKICSEIFADIDSNCVSFIPNYDNTTTEPILLPTTFPNILVSANTGIAVGMASSFCGFNITEVCLATCERIKNPDYNPILSMKAPDFPTGGEIILHQEEMEKIYDTGRGSFKVRSKWKFIKELNLIEVSQIPYTTTIEAIIDKIAELIKLGKIRDIIDVRDETDLKGLKITIDLKRSTDPEKLMQKLFKMTPLMDTFSCNFNLLIDGMPKVLGVSAIIDEWVLWRSECVKKKLLYNLSRLKEKLHLLNGLKKILLDIDKAIRIIRETEADIEVIPNLMIGFGIDKIQADFVAELKLRNINKEYILKRTNEIDTLTKDINNLEITAGSTAKIRNLIIKELENIIKKYDIGRKTDIIYHDEVTHYDFEDHIDDYPVHIFLTKSGYFKKITPASYRVSSEHKFKDSDTLLSTVETTNKSEVIILTNKMQAYKTRLYEFDDHKASILGDYLPAKLNMETDEIPVFMFCPDDYNSNLIITFENGKVAKIDVKSFATKTNRRKLANAYSDKSPAINFFHIKDDIDIAMYSSGSRALIFNTISVPSKTTKSTQGIQVLILRSNTTLVSASANIGELPEKYRVKNIPAIGTIKPAGQLEF